MRSVALVAAALIIAAAGANAQYDSPTAMEALYYCKAAYCDSTTLPGWTCPTCVLHHTSFTSVSVFRNATDQFLAYTGYNPTTNRIVVAFRGTDNLKNWIKDLNFFKTSYPGCAGCEVHEGFYEAWKSVKSGVMSSVANLVSANPSAASILVTGHSLGAAVSLFAALDLAQMYPSITQHLYNFGEPRVGTSTFVAWAVGVLQDGKQYRVTHDRDPVPHVPPMILDFLHVPHEEFYANDGSTSWVSCQDSASGEDPNCSDNYDFYHVYDHVMYLGKCTNCENQPGSDGQCAI